MAAAISWLAGCDSATAPANASPARIVSLVPSVTETLFALGAGPEVVGVSQYCDYPPEASKLPKVGDFIAPNLEAIVALRPALVIGIATASGQRQARALNAMGIPALMVNDDSIAEVEANISSIGHRVGRSAEAARLRAAIEDQIAQIEQRLN